MKKTDKALENTIVKVLTQVCEESLETVEGFQWLTHLSCKSGVNYKDFSRSLTVICVFETRTQIAELKNSPQYDFLTNSIIRQLGSVGIQLSKKQIKLDSEEACNLKHAGNWANRLQ